MVTCVKYGTFLKLTFLLFSANLECKQPLCKPLPSNHEIIHAKSLASVCTQRMFKKSWPRERRGLGSGRASSHPAPCILPALLLGSVPGASSHSPTLRLPGAPLLQLLPLRQEGRQLSTLGLSHEIGGKFLQRT